MEPTYEYLVRLLYTGYEVTLVVEASNADSAHRKAIHQLKENGFRATQPFPDIRHAEVEVL